ncbi:DsbA family protein [Arthrobacter sp. 35W]|uniref:DsbA family protein n=1 Tax=Arthrobacter sp. 35W TaxID=1132441 RepID=UPI000428D852|nr:thioredoxin domain-containing protein [Arthrobacter sp. 35W]
MTSTPPVKRDPAKTARLLFWALLAVLAGAMVVWYFVFAAGKAAPEAAVPAGGAQLVREDSHRLTSPAAEKAQLVEFLDFECESCAEVQPFVDELKAEFGDRITFVARYFPLPGHANSTTAAVAVEASAQQGMYQQMYQKMFDTQAQWGEQQVSQAALFRSYAQELGLDMAAYDAAVADEKTKERIRTDIADGTALGVTGTPTFFLQGQKLALTTRDAFRQALAEAAK